MDWRGAVIYGAPGESRTLDLFVRNEMLYPSELRAHSSHYRRFSGVVCGDLAALMRVSGDATKQRIFMPHLLAGNAKRCHFIHLSWSNERGRREKQKTLIRFFADLQPGSHCKIEGLTLRRSQPPAHGAFLSAGCFSLRHSLCSCRQSTSLHRRRSKATDGRS
jgi:hypothetical protein